ncbi:putative polyamine oxidase 4 [Paramyrothecium foliicola]|nr:putative polyamine oxidase 4 [Paramyrothecium foliicola]
MDAYSMSLGSRSSGRLFSRIYEDLLPTDLDRAVDVARYTTYRKKPSMADHEEQVKPTPAPNTMSSYLYIVPHKPFSLKLINGYNTNTLLSQRARESRSKPHIGIIGAGVAGLRCADVLLGHGFQVTIIEARNRLGGRVQQAELLNKHVVDMGPNWIHGTAENPILHLAEAMKTAVSDRDTQTNVYDRNGELFPLKEGERYSTIMWDIIQDAFKFSNEHGSNIDPARSLQDFFRERLTEVLPETEDDYERKRNIVMELSAMWGAFVGSPISKQSLKFFWLEECIEGENLFCAGTYKKILETIAKPAVAGAEILLDTKAESIGYRDESEMDVAVTVQGGRTLSFDAVVVTAPLGWLKRNTKAFSPPLPERITRAIGSLGYGCLEKVYITFSKAFWLQKGADGRDVRGFVQWIAPDYAASTNPEGWNQEVVELADLGDEHSHPTLLFYTYGDQSNYLVKKLAKMSDQKEKDEFVFNFFKPYYSRLPNYVETDDDCKPVASLATGWLLDEFAGHGSYTNFQVGLTEGDEDVQVLRVGMPKNSLYFAGEHAAPYVALGTTTGAYWSGEAVAKRIADSYGHSK